MRPAAAAVVALTGLAALQAATPAAATPVVAAERADIHVFVNDSCIVADEPYYLPSDEVIDRFGPPGAKVLPLLGLAVGKLAELFISHEIEGAAERIKAHAVRQDTRYSLARPMNLYRADLATAPVLKLNSRLGCMTIVAAKLQPEGSDCTAAYLPKTLAADARSLPQDEWHSSRQDDSVENALRRANICVDGQARALYEARFEFSDDGTAYRLRDAGYRINALLTTDDRNAVRTALYTLKISEPARSGDEEVLSTAWIKLGTVRAGARGAGTSGTGGTSGTAGTSGTGGTGGSEAVPWLRVPALADDARRVYEERTRVQQEVSAEIDALDRALTRSQRLLAGLDRRIAAADDAVAEGLRQERTRVAVERETQSAELEARKAEYQDLPRAPIELMPVTVEVAVTETESEKKAQLALAEIIGGSSGLLAASAGNAATGLLSKSTRAADLRTEPDSATPETQLQEARRRYYDAWVAVRTGAAGDDAAPRELAAARLAYNVVRRRHGLPPID